MVNQISRMEQVVQSYVADKQFMGSILVMQKGRELLNKGYGYANLEWQIPNTPTTKFRIGSITKQFTAAAILLLVDKGKLTLSDTIKKHIPDTPSAWDTITIQNLLTHVSGIPNYTGFPEFVSMMTSKQTPEQLIERFRNKPLDFHPGSSYMYNNSGYVLLGYLIEIISNQSYQEFVVNNLFKPLSMNDSGYDSHSAILLQRASGYTLGSNGFLNADYIDMSIPYAAGSLYSTTKDLSKWVKALFGGKVLSPDSLKKMITPNANEYGFGVIMQPVDGCNTILHGGGINGFNSLLLYSPEECLLVIVLANLNGIGFVPGDLATKLVTIAHNNAVILASERKKAIVSPESLAHYVGTYSVKSLNKAYPKPQVHFIITLEDGNLMVEGAKLPKTKLFPESETKFFGRMPDVQIEFTRKEKVLKFVLHQDGENSIGEKIA
ncbi:TPA: serine hydrolase [Legionella pneumophila]|nr:serine hydrolase [Legionella pneumophila]HAU0358581.1 serine hydrolase [Legionella pneumophila]HAU0567129.1 serine hydrolase [Legionella pneumophila]